MSQNKTTKYSNQKKLEVYNSPILKQQNKISQSLYYHYLKSINNEIKLKDFILPLNETLELHEQLSTNFPEDYDCAKHINLALRRKNSKIKKNCFKILQNFQYLYFYTITFDDLTLLSYNIQQLKKLVIKHLNSFNCPYIYSYSISEETSRPHFHVFIPIQPDTIKFKFGLTHHYLIADTNNIDINIKKKLYNPNFIITNKYINTFLHQSNSLLIQKITYLTHNSYFTQLITNQENRIITKFPKNYNILSYLENEIF